MTDGSHICDLTVVTREPIIIYVFYQFFKVILLPHKNFVTLPDSRDPFFAIFFNHFITRYTEIDGEVRTQFQSYGLIYIMILRFWVGV